MKSILSDFRRSKTAILEHDLVLIYIQGDPNQNPLFQMAVALTLCISDPILVKPKWV